MKNPFLVLRKDCGEAVRWISDHLNQSGLQVVQTFDFPLRSPNQLFAWNMSYHEWMYSV